MAQDTATGVGILKGPKSDRPSADDVPDDTEWLVTDAGGGNGYELTEAQGGSWTSKPLHTEDVLNDRQYFTVGDIQTRTQEVAEAQEIRDEAGVRDGVTVGVEDGVSPGVRSASAQSGASRIEISTESEASTAADRQETADDGSTIYVIEDKVLDNSEGTTNANGLQWVDGDAAYKLKLENVEITGYPEEQISIFTATELIIEDSLIHDPDTPGIRVDEGGLRCRRVDFGGLGDDGVICYSPGDYVFVNCQWTDSQRTWASSASLETNDSATVTMEHCDFTGSVASAVKHGADGAVYNIDACYSDVRFLDARSGNDFGTDSYIYDCEINSPAATARGMDIVGASGGNLEIGWCYFNDTAKDIRPLRIAKHSSAGRSKNIRVHHCRGKKTTGSGAGNEVFESFDAVGVRFEYCWVEECTEDAFEHVNAKGCVIAHCVADNCDGEIADIFEGQGGPGTESLSWVHHIYGETTGDDAVAITDADKNLVHDIYAAAPNGTGIDFNQDSASADTSPKDNVILGPLPLDDNCQNGPFTENGDAHDTNYVFYSKNGALQAPFKAVDHAAMQSRADSVVRATNVQTEIR